MRAWGFLASAMAYLTAAADVSLKSCGTRMWLRAIMTPSGHAEGQALCRDSADDETPKMPANSQVLENSPEVRLASRADFPRRRGNFHVSARSRQSRNFPSHNS